MKIEDVQPCNDRILIEIVTEEEQQYQGLIQTVMHTQEKSNIALVIALPYGYNETGVNRLTTGQRVLFNRHSGSGLVLDKFDHNAKEYRLIKESDILAVLSQ